jgi:pyrroline-5-carboxylate reductase
MMRAAVLGTGSMGSALARALCRAIGPDQVVVANRTKDKAITLASELGCAVAANSALAAKAAKYLLLCVKPQQLPQLLADLSPVLADCHAREEDKVLVSVAAGVSLDDLARYAEGAGYAVPVARLMPNTCVAVGQGMIALCTPEGTAEAVLLELQDMLSQAGRVAPLPEQQMDAFTAVAGCGPAFVDLFVEALADGGVRAGLPRQQALTYAAQTALGAAAMVLQTGQHPGALKDAVCSPGGSTIEGVAALERGGLRAAVLDAVDAAWKRNGELGKS